MEFPGLGKHCGINACQTLDFLPVECRFCHVIFCKDHAEISNHNCDKVVNNVAIEAKVSENFKCCAENCKATDAVEMTCVKCSKHFCLEHRHHGCLDSVPCKSKVEKYRLPKEQFKKAKAETDAMVQDKLKKAKNRALANKIKLMKIKGLAVGLNTIPTTNRSFFLVAPPVNSSGQSRARAFFVDKFWSCGRAIDYLAKKLKTENTNNHLQGPQLRLFSSEGSILSEELNVSLQSLIEDCTLVDGDSLILEYITPEQMNVGFNIFVDDRCLEKYTFV